jgi:hypothetical protein
MNSPILNAQSDYPLATQHLLYVMPSFQQNVLFGSLGCRITLPSAGSEANANPGNPSVTRLIHKI